MGDKIRAKETVSAAGVPVVPGSPSRGLTDARTDRGGRARSAMPVLLKPSAGGGGKGMRLVRRRRRAAGRVVAAPGARPRAAFGDDTLLVERLGRPAPAHRDPGPGRRPRQRRPPRRARVLACSAATRRSSRRRRRRCSTRRPGPRIGAAAVRGRALRRLRRRGHRRVHRVRRPARRVLLHGDEHPPAGRAPGDRAGHRPRPGRVAAAGRGRRAAAVRAGGHHA